MNKRGQLVIMSVAFGLLIFFVFYSIFFAGFLQQQAEQVIEEEQLTGLEAFFWAYINLWVIIGVLLGVLITVYIGGSR